MIKSTVQLFGDQQVHVGDIALGHVIVSLTSRDGKVLPDFQGIVPIRCVRIENDQPCWQAAHVFGDASLGIELQTMPFVEGELFPVNSWKWRLPAS